MKDAYSSTLVSDARADAAEAGASAMGGLWARVSAWLLTRRTQRELRTLSDAQLRDIGLTREQIEQPEDWLRRDHNRRAF